MTLPVNIDSSYPDRNPGDAAHQQHHDTVHAIVNDPATNWPEGNAAYRAPFVPASHLALGSGSPQLVQGNNGANSVRFPVWKLDPTSTEGIDGSIIVPAGATAVTVGVLWKSSATSGDAVFQVVLGSFAAGENVGSNQATGSLVTATTAATAHVATDTTLISNSVVTAGDVLAIRLIRQAAEAADTLTVDVEVLGLTLVWA